MSCHGSSNSARGARVIALARRKPWLETPDGRRSVIFLLLLVLWLVATTPARAAESPSQVALPEPWAFLSPDSISFAVVRALPGDDGIRELLDTAWDGLKSANSEATKGFLGLVLKWVQGDQSNALMGFLPLQMVRVDALDPVTALPHPTLAVTVAGWSGLQQPFYSTMTKGSDGKPYPTKDLEDATLILRDGWEDPSRSHILTRINGTFVSFPTVSKAESTVKLLAATKKSVPKGQISELLPNLNAKSDTYGVLLNRQGSLLKFLTWLNKTDVGRAQDAVGQERLDAVMAKVSSMTWEGDLVSDDAMKLRLEFRTDSPEARKALTAVLKDVRGILDEYGRAGEMETTGLGNELHVDFTMVGYREMLKSYVSRSL